MIRKSTSSSRFTNSRKLQRLRNVGFGATAAYAVTLVASGVALAADEAPGAALEEIVVTAQFRSENVQQTPIAITALSASMLEQRSQTTLSEVTAQAPNVKLEPNSGSFGPSMAASIRGVGQGDFDPALEPGVGMYIDDVYYSSLLGSNFELLDLDRVEILRGPQGTLAGKNSIGGSIKLYSKKPDGNGGGFAELTYGQFSRIDVRAAGDFTILPDTLFVRLSGASKSQDGFVKELDYACAHPGSGLPSQAYTPASCELGTEGGRNYTAGRAAIRWIASDKLEINLQADATNEHSDPSPSVLIGVVPISNAPGNPNNLSPLLPAPAQHPILLQNGIGYDSRFITAGSYTNYANYFDPGYYGTGPTDPAYRPGKRVPQQQTVKSWGTSGTVDLKFTDTLALKSITSYREFHTLWGQDNDYSPIPIDTGSNAVANHSFSQELRLNGAVSTLVDYTIGGFYFDQKTTYATRQDLLIPLPGPNLYAFTFDGNDPVDATTKAAFIHTIWHLTDQLNLTAGYRYTDEKKDYTFVRTIVGTDIPHPFFGPPGSSVNGTTGKFAGTRSDYRLGLDYRWTQDFMTYVQYSTGYKGGGISPRPYFSTQAQPFGPEQLDAYEVGAKSALFNNRVRLNAAVFYNKYKDIQLGIQSCPGFTPNNAAGPCAMEVNGGNATVKGAEVEAEVLIVDGLSIDASASYLDFKYNTLLPAVIDAGVTKDMVTAFTPKYKFSAGVQYEIPLGNLGSLTPRVDASYTDSVYAATLNNANSFVPSYTIANARLTWRSNEDEWQTALEVTNLTDKYYYRNKFDVSASEGALSATVGAPRMWAVTVKRNFK